MRIQLVMENLNKSMICITKPRGVSKVGAGKAFPFPPTSLFGKLLSQIFTLDFIADEFFSLCYVAFFDINGNFIIHKLKSKHTFLR